MDEDDLKLTVHLCDPDPAHIAKYQSWIDDQARADELAKQDHEARISGRCDGCGADVGEQQLKLYGGDALCKACIDVQLEADTY